MGAGRPPAPSMHIVPATYVPGGGGGEGGGGNRAAKTRSLRKALGCGAGY